MKHGLRPSLFILLALGLALVMMGCSSAGPFVTNISSDGQGNLVVEKNMVHYNSFTGNISLGDNPTTQIIRIQNPPYAPDSDNPPPKSEDSESTDDSSKPEDDQQ